MSRIRKNKKFIDPRYFMDEKMEVLSEGKISLQNVDQVWMAIASARHKAEKGKRISLFLGDQHGGESAFANSPVWLSVYENRPGEYIANAATLRGGTGKKVGVGTQGADALKQALENFPNAQEADLQVYG